MGYIPQQSYEPIRDLIVQVFTFRDLEQVLYRCPGANRLSDFANKGWPPGDVATETLQFVENRGIAKQFLSGLLEARPYRSDLRDRFVTAMPDLAEARSTRDSVDQVIGGLGETLATMDDPAIRVAVATSRDTLQSFAEKIIVLAAYKDLHDSLHQIQIRRFSDLRTATARMADPDQHDKLVAYLDLLAPAIGVARNAASRLPDGAQFRAKEESWIVRLASAEGQLGAALAKLDADAARLAIKVVARVLMHQPPELNQSIFLTAQELSVQRLTEALEKVGALNAAARATLGGATAALRDIRDTLERRVDEHRQWQDADDKLGALDEVFQQAGNDVFASFSEDWPAAKAAVKRIVALSPGQDWAVQLLAGADATDDELTRLDAEPGADPRAMRERIYRRYSDFRHGARMRFFRIDQLLKEHCDAIVGIGAPLQAILKELSS